jgi:rhamnulokinase
MRDRALLAFDLGAASGRAMLGLLRDRRLQVKELHRFPNGMINLRGRLQWNVVQLFQELKRGMALCASEARVKPESVGIDTWGVDFGLLAADGSLLGLPYAYRDPQTAGAMEAFFCRVPRERVYELTGVQFLRFNSLFQLFAMARDRSPLLEAASDLLFMPDIFNYLLTGEKRTEFTYATTSQLYNPREERWEEELLEAVGVSQDIMQDIVPPGTVVGTLGQQICEETGLGATPVVATASHDTAAAVAAVPAEGRDWAYISSGTWSLMGVESEEPIIGDQSLAFNFTNEGGVGGTFRVLRNIAGLWPVQQCQKAWAGETTYDYEELTEMASRAGAFGSLIEPDAPDFLNPSDMAEAVREFCRRTGQAAPVTPGEVIRCILESLALKCRMVLDQVRQVYRHPINRIHVIGGGARNELLCQLTASAAGVPVVAGPSEATAIGNLLVQALALGHVRSLAEMREVVRLSFPTKRYEPGEAQEWGAAYERFQELHARTLGHRMEAGLERSGG